MIQELFKGFLQGVTAAAAGRCPACPPAPEVNLTCPAAERCPDGSKVEIVLVFIAGGAGVVFLVLAFVLGYVVGRRSVSSPESDVKLLARAQLRSIRGRDGEAR